ncbi:MAG TPA: ABC transporter ATP-binding protein [Proteobacteria bacterium]|nr:ABC transporter ATP-binding protein [Pseudomonadota bacterium]
MFGFLGPNGAGKTTTIRMLTGLIIPDSGEVFIDGIAINKNPIAAKMKIGVIPETGNVYLDLSAKQNLTLAGRFYGITGRDLEARADYLLKEFGLAGRKDNRVRSFSRGMKQRVNVACALIHNPDILFLDEPTVGLDVRSRKLIRTIITRMNREGTTIFLTTHDLEEANLLCERIGIINQGNMVALDRPEKLRSTFESARSVEISFDRPVEEEKLRGLSPLNRWEKMGDKWKLFTENPDRLVKQLTGLAREENLTIVTLEICRASLEEVFIKLTENKSDEG